MEQPKPNRRQRFWNYVTGQKEKTKEYEEIPLAGNAIRIVADKKLATRMEEWKVATDLINEPIHATTLYGYMTELIDITETVGIAVKRVGLVFDRSGDTGNEEEATAVRGWSNLYGIFHSMAIRIRFEHGTNETVTTTASEKQTIHAIKVRDFHLSLENVLFKKADMIIGWSFKNIDVTTGVVTVVNTFPVKGSVPYGYEDGLGAQK
ncbi:MAG: hypothetical protein WC325_11075 [Candidatus Bathyarchaeia archaeon]|jgi:hypothetical protein